MLREDNPQPAVVPTEIWEFSVGNGFVVVRPDLPYLFCLNSTARIIWQAYRRTGSREVAADVLVDTFGIARELATDDVATTLSSWTQAGLLGQARPEAPPKWNGLKGEPLSPGYFALEGTRFEVLTDSADVIEEVTPRLAGIRVQPCTPDVRIGIWTVADDLFAIVEGDRCVAIQSGVRATRALLFQELARLARPGRDWLALLHAGACGMDGRCVLFPASSYAGKSTLAAALMANGFTLYSDDFLGLESDTLKIPAMPFATAIRLGSWDVLRPCIPDIDQYPVHEGFGEQVKFLPLPEPLGVPAEAIAIVFSQWIAGAEISFEPLSTAEVIERLNESGFWVRPDEPSIAAFLDWLERLPKFALRYGELSDAITQVNAILKAPNDRVRKPPV